MRQEAQRSEVGNAPRAMSADELLAAVRLPASLGSVRVIGTVDDLRPHPRERPTKVYGDLRGMDGVITFCCPLDAAPAFRGERVVIVGSPQLLPARMHPGVEVQLVGDVIERPAAVESAAGPLLADVARVRTPLDGLLRSALPRHVVVVASKRAWEDLATAAVTAGITGLPEWIECDMTRQRAILDTARRAAGNPGTKAIAFARGGSDAKSLAIWSDPGFVLSLIQLGAPIYTALGHSDSLLLVDVHADQAFPTPTSLGTAMATAVKSRAESEKLRARLAEAIAVSERWKEHSDAMALRVEEARAEAKRRGRTVAVVVAIAAALAACLGAIVFAHAW